MPAKNNELQRLMNIGPATAADLTRLEVTSIEKLKESDAHELYDRISTLDGVKHDICVLDTFTAIIENAKTGEAKPWWYYSQIRKGEAIK